MNNPLQDAVSTTIALHERREGVASEICGHCTDIAQLQSIDPFYEIPFPCATILRIEVALNSDLR